MCSCGQPQNSGKLVVWRELQTCPPVVTAHAARSTAGASLPVVALFRYVKRQLLGCPSVFLCTVESLPEDSWVALWRKSLQSHVSL